MEDWGLTPDAIHLQSSRGGPIPCHRGRGCRSAQFALFHSSGREYRRGIFLQSRYVDQRESLVAIASARVPFDGALYYRCTTVYTPTGRTVEPWCGRSQRPRALKATATPCATTPAISDADETACRQVIARATPCDFRLRLQLYAGKTQGRLLCGVDLRLRWHRMVPKPNRTGGKSWAAWEETSHPTHCASTRADQKGVWQFYLPKMYPNT